MNRRRKSSSSSSSSSRRRRRRRNLPWLPPCSPPSSRVGRDATTFLLVENKKNNKPGNPERATVAGCIQL